MREILFRGKRISNGEWVYGGIVTSPHPNYNHPMVYAICSNMMDIFVDQDSIGQYTGLTDKNGKKIFEGDIVNILPEVDEIGVIEWADDEAMFELNADGWCANFDNYLSEDVEVIGNIHDNPELLEGGCFLMAELKPCPFCGGEAEVNAMGWKCKDGKDRYFVECSKCGTRCGFKALPVNQAIEKWNRRAEDADQTKA